MLTGISGETVTERKQNKNLKPFKKGESGNPDGRPAIPHEVREQIALNRDEFVMKISEHLRMPMTDLEALLKSKEVTPLDMMIGNIVKEAAKAKDMSRVNFIVDRTVGPLETVSKSSLNLTGQSLHMALVDIMSGSEKKSE